MKLLATDMDGTFLRDDKSYSEEFNDLYKQMLKQGIQFVIASGNQYEALACKFDEEIKNDLYYLCENGTKIVYQGKTLYKKALKKEDAKEILDILKQDQECMLVVSGDKHAYISKSLETLAIAKKNKALQRALETEIPDEVYQELEAIITNE